MVLRLTASYLAVFLIVLGAISFAIYFFIANTAKETLEPLLFLPIGQQTLAATTQRLALTIALADVPLIVIVGIASYILATVSVRPLARAREREIRFTADAAHELRTPLATIASVAQAARGEATADAALARIAQIALDASGLIGDLLLLMRDTPEGTRLHEPLDLGALALGVADDARSRRPDLTIRATAAPGGSFVIGDAAALRRIAINLIDNAARHAHTTIEVVVLANPSAVTLSVEDDGPGVAEVDRERIFERFYKVGTEHDGAGLGLAIARKIAEAHGGSIILEGRARFIVGLPRAPV